jgi:HEPN domain-containing protein
LKKRESLLPQDWFRKGDLDIRRSKILIDNDDPEGAAFHLQQAIEKYLKGHLISRGWKLDRIHEPIPKYLLSPFSKGGWGDF